MVEKIITGIVIDKFPFEDEHIIKILSEGGNVVSLKAKGLDKYESKNRISLSLFNKVELEYFSSPSNGNSGRLKRSSMVKEYLADSDLSYSVTQLLKDILLSLNNYNNVIFVSLEKVLFSLENNTYNFQKILTILILILRNEKYTPVVDRCVKCGSNQDIGAFSLYEGGLICKNHEEASKYKLSGDTLRKIIEINSLYNPIECRNLNFTPDEITKIKSMYKLFIENQMGLNLYMIDKI